MSLKIELEHGPDHVYFPAQDVNGILKYTVWKQRNIHNVNIVFRGKVETEYVEGRRGAAGNTHGPRKRAQEIHRLFAYSQKLFSGPFDVKPQTFAWPFSFNIPTHVESRRIGNSTPGFIPDGWSVTPPTFAFAHSTFGHNAYAKVKYKLIATVTTGGFSSGDELELPVTISRLAIDAPPSPRLFVHPFLPLVCWESRSLRDKSLSLKEKLRQAFSDNPEFRTPCIAFKAYIHFPKSISPSQKFRVGFSLMHCKNTQNDPSDPLLILTSLRISCKNRTKLVAATHELSLSGDRYADSSTNETDKPFKFHPLKLPLNGDQVILSDNECLADWKSGGAMAWQSDFSTYTVHFSHMVKVQATIVHNDTKHQFSLKTELPLEILEPHASELAGASNMIVPIAPRPQAIELEEEDLPRYEDDFKPPDLDVSAYGETSRSMNG